MKTYLVSLGAGLLVGVIYSLINVRSPAPPVATLIGLLGILVGEPIIPVGKRVSAGTCSGAASASAEATSIATIPEVRS